MPVILNSIEGARSMADETVTHWIGRLKSQDEEALKKIWERYFDRVVRSARKRLKGGPRSSSDEEDIAVSVFESLYYGMAKGHFPKLDNRDDLWQVLVVLTARRILNAREHDRALKRGGGKVRGDSAVSSPASQQTDSPKQGFDQLPGTDTDPSLISEVTERCQQLVNLLEDEQLRQVALWRLEGYTVEEIAGPDKLNCSVRSVERRLQLIRQRWASNASLDLPLH